MAKGDQFKTLYKAQYSAQGTLTNEKIPDKVNDMITYVILLEDFNPDAPKLCIGWLAAMMPPFKKYFMNYDELMSILNECRTLRLEWVHHKKTGMFPIELKNKLYTLYEKWWEAYNDSGAGIKGEVFDPNRGSKLYDSVVGRVRT